MPRSTDKQAEKGEIFRAVKDRHHPYRVMNTDPYSDQQLSWKARGVLAYMLSRPDGWEIRFWDLVKRGDVGRDQMRAILWELRLVGYMKRTTGHDANGEWTWTNDVYESPLPPEERDTREPKTPSPENQSLVPSPEIPATVAPSPVNQSLYESLNEKLNERNNEENVIVALERLGLTLKQATSFAQQHRLTVEEVAEWGAWKKRIDPEKYKPIKVLVSMLKKQRLPPSDNRTAATREPTNDDFRKYDTLNAQLERDAETEAFAARRRIEVQDSDGATRSLSIKQVWQATLGDLQVNIPRNEWETWITPTTLIDLEDSIAIVGTPNIFVRQELEGHYLETIAHAIQTVIGVPVKVQVVIGSHG